MKSGYSRAFFGTGAALAVAYFAITAGASPKDIQSGDKSSVQLRKGCGDSCPLTHVDGFEYTPEAPVVASPEGLTYSVHHRLGADPDGNGPNPSQCRFVFNTQLPGAQDDVVTFDGVVENIRSDFFNTVPTVDESELPQANGNRLIVIDTASTNGADLFPGGVKFLGTPLTDACFAIGLDDPLEWPGMDTVVDAEIIYRKDGQDFLGPFDIASFFQSPWDGSVEIVLPDHAGMGIDGVHIEILIHKSVNVPNDDCSDRIPVTTQFTGYSTLGAITDGLDHLAACRESSYSQIDADIWYSYTATCTGTLTVDLCNSDYDTRLAVYAGCTRCPPDDLPLDCDDDASCGVSSLVSVPVTQGQCYTIRVGGYQNQQGTGTMRVQCDVTPPSGACCLNQTCAGTTTENSCLSQNGVWHLGSTCPAFSCPAPANDECVDCIRVLTGTPYNGTTIAAGGEFVSTCGNDSDDKDVWHCWTADCNGLVDIDTCGSGFDTTLSVYDDCDGNEIRCDDDSCAPLKSKVTLNAVEGTTYYFRVAGINSVTGNYKLTVNPCRNACCTAQGQCFMVSEATCNGANPPGNPLGDGTVCLTDANGNQINDACETDCPTANIANSVPADGTVDARQPHSVPSTLPRTGIGAPGEAGSRREGIQVLLIPRLALVEECFSVCETVVDSLLGSIDVLELNYLGSGLYEFVFDRAITAGGVTTIKFEGGAGTFVDFVRHPGNVNGDSIANFADVQQVVNCCLKGQCPVTYGDYSCDIDHSTRRTPLDILAEIDVLNGAGTLTAWNNTAKPTIPNGTCP